MRWLGCSFVITSHVFFFFLFTVDSAAEGRQKGGAKGHRLGSRLCCCSRDTLLLGELVWCPDVTSFWCENLFTWGKTVAGPRLNCATSDIPINTLLTLFCSRNLHPSCPPHFSLIFLLSMGVCRTWVYAHNTDQSSTRVHASKNLSFS